MGSTSSGLTSGVERKRKLMPLMRGSKLAVFVSPQSGSVAFTRYILWSGSEVSRLSRPNPTVYRVALVDRATGVGSGAMTHSSGEDAISASAIRVTVEPS